MVMAGAFIAAGLSTVFAGEFSGPWHSKNSSIVLDAYEYTPLDWNKLKHNKRLAGFINKASDGLSPKAGCGRNALCRVKWKRYVATRELYHTRKVLAKTLGMKWGAYHLARPGNPIQQAEHFLQFTRPDKDDLLALDIEHNDPRRWMSLGDAEKFARHVKARIGRYPVLYTNHSTAKYIAAHRDKLPLLSRLNLWYARYKPSVPRVFPMGNWKSYTLWQFSSMVNCNNKTCLRRINGAGNWIDVNVVNMSPAELKKQWPFAKLRAKLVPIKKVAPAVASLVGSVKKSAVASVVQSASVSTITSTEPMLDIGTVITPTWRPGAKIVKRETKPGVSQLMMAFQLRDKKPFQVPSSVFQGFPVEKVVFNKGSKPRQEDLADQI